MRARVKFYSRAEGWHALCTSNHKNSITIHINAMPASLSVGWSFVCTFYVAKKLKVNNVGFSTRKTSSPGTYHVLRQTVPEIYDIFLLFAGNARHPFLSTVIRRHFNYNSSSSWSRIPKVQLLRSFVANLQVIPNMLFVFEILSHDTHLWMDGWIDRYILCGGNSNVPHLLLNLFNSDHWAESFQPHHTAR